MRGEAISIVEYQHGQVDLNSSQVENSLKTSKMRLRIEALIQLAK